MRNLASNITSVLSKKGEKLTAFLKRHFVSDVEDLPLKVIADLAATSGHTLEDFILRPIAIDRSKLSAIKLLILDVDGVMTDAGMYFTESGDQFKKYNAKDGMAIMALTTSNFQVGIISSGFKLEMVKARAELLGIQNVYVGRDSKLQILNEWCQQLGIQLSEVAIIGDDINDLEVMRSIGFSACPADAVNEVKKQVDLILSLKGGEGCVREFIDNYLLEKPVTR
jgi:3-deoxy-D-manno-octulosonate 8-phosphate phosphatase (KDO 8-P phosphatase)